MNKSVFVKEFQYSRRMQRVAIKSNSESNEEYANRIKIAKYGLDGEERVYFHLNNIPHEIVCLSNLRLDETYGSAQADFVVISKEAIYLLEVKNLYGNIRVTDNGEVIRVIPRDVGNDEEGMDNPFTQINRQASVFEIFLKQNEIELPVKTLIVMGNPRTAIYMGKENYPIIRYDRLKEYFNNEIKSYCNIDEYNYIMEVGQLMSDKNKERYFNDFDVLQSKMQANNRYQPSLQGKDLALYEDLLEERKRIAANVKWPLCNVFLNRDAENLVIYKPQTREQFILIPGFKEKKYNLFGEAVMDIIKKYVLK